MFTTTHNEKKKRITTDVKQENQQIKKSEFVDPVFGTNFEKL